MFVLSYRLDDQDWVSTPCGVANFGSATHGAYVLLENPPEEFRGRFIGALDSFVITNSVSALVSPTSATLDQPTTFSVTGTALPGGLGFDLADCTPRDAEVFDSSTSPTLRKFRCTPRGSPGLKYGRVKTSPTGTTLANFQVNVVGPNLSAAPSQFMFDALISDQQAGVPFPVTIRAADGAGTTVTGFGSPVTLADTAGKTISPNRASFVNGIATVQVTVLSGGFTRLSASYTRTDGNDASGSTNEFDVARNDGRLGYSVRGTAKSGATIILATDPGAATVASTVAASGKFAFSNVPKGRYTIRATLATWYQVDWFQSLYIDRDLDGVAITLSQRNPPVILLPGMMGSTLRSTAISRYETQVPRNFGDHIVGAAPKLPKTKCRTKNATELVAPKCDLADDLEIYDPTIADAPGTAGVRQSDGSALGTSLLTNALLTAGYDVYPTPWDWRHTFEDAADIYLKPKIKAIRDATGYAKVDIVAHSMGGLVARSYIQSDDYDTAANRDVGRLIMMGTPNEGSSKAYLLVEGGSPPAADSAGASLGSTFVAQAALYTGAVNELHRTIFSEDLYTLSSDNDIDSGSDLRRYYSTKYVQNFLNGYVPGGRELLPTYDFLRQPSGSLVSTPSLNNRLKTLNAAAATNRFVPLGSTASSAQVPTKLFLSTSDIRTLGEIDYQIQGTLGQTYDLGVPYNYRHAAGDGTVLSGHADAGVFTGAKQQSGAYYSHQFMVGYLRPQVVSSLQCTACAASSLSLKAAAIAISAPFAGLTVSLGVDADRNAVLTAPGGLQTGTRGSDGLILEQIPNSEVANLRHGSRINIFEPSVGIYSMQVAAQPTGVGTASRVVIDYTKAGDRTRQLTTRFLQTIAPYVVRLQVDSAASSVVSILGSISPPTLLRATRDPAGTQLTWAAATGGVSGYRAYSRSLDQAKFQLRGTTTLTQFLSDIPWSTSVEDASEFVVVSFNAAGDESLILEANAVVNRSFVNAKFSAGAASSNLALGTMLPATLTFADRSEASSPITAWAWDFNSDGVVDSTAQNPTFALPAYGQYTVSLTVTTEDGVDTAIKPALITVSPCAPLEQSASCSLDVNGDGRVDTRDGLLILRRMLGFSGAALTDGVVNASCGSASTQATIAGFVDNQIAGGHYNFDGGPSGATAASSGLIIYRALQGLTDSGVTASTVRPGATRTSWAGAGQIRDYLNLQCGAGL